MYNAIYFTSEKDNKFGVNSVVKVLREKLSTTINITISKNPFDIFLLKPNLIHIHGCWHPRLFIAFLLAKFFLIKVIISPHGMIDPYSFSQKKIKKIIAWYLYQKFIFIFSNLIIVNSRLEKKNLEKKLKFKKKIIVIKHGILIDPSYKLNVKKKKSKRLKFVFYSRIHPSKNLIKLIELWISNSFFLNYNLDIFGEIMDKKYFMKIKKLIKNKKNINYKGLIKKKKYYTLSKYDVFIHPSESENFGLVILEAMYAGLFPLVNKKLDWRILEKNNFGITLNFTTNQLKKNIQKLIKKSKEIRGNKFKKNMLNFILENYNWENIVKSYLSYYLKLKRNEL